jgi:hypothetical protein
MRDDERFIPADELPDDILDRARALRDTMVDVVGFTVPWLGGRSLDGRDFYPDNDLPAVVDGVETGGRRGSVKLHECAEKIMMDEGHTYDKDSDPPGDAHYIANGCEKVEVEEQGGSWEPYCLAMRPLVKETDHPDLTDLPPFDRWDRRPYEDDDPALESEIETADKRATKQVNCRCPDIFTATCVSKWCPRRATKSTFAQPGSATSGLQGYDLEGAGKQISKKKAKYTDGPDEKEPCETCTMFKGPSSCTLVKGEISPQGHCKYFAAITKVLTFGEAMSNKHVAKSFLELIPSDPVVEAEPAADGGATPALAPVEQPRDWIEKIVTRLVEAEQQRAAIFEKLTGQIALALADLAKRQADIVDQKVTPRLVGQLAESLVDLAKRQEESVAETKASSAQIASAIADIAKRQSEVVVQAPAQAPAPLPPINLNITIERQSNKKTVQVNRQADGSLVGSVVETEEPEAK